ncbi:MAG: type IV pilus assembly protein PilM [Planctomycetota bacterium]|jgi:type IV pilus assembly protein PilM
MRLFEFRNYVAGFKKFDWKALLKRKRFDWKALLKRKRIDVLGLDIGTFAVKVVQLRKDGASFRVTAAGIVEIPNGTESDENRRKINNIKAIRSCLQSAGASIQLAVSSVSGPEVAVRDFKFPQLSVKEIEGAVMLEAAQVCPFNIDDGKVDYQLVPDGDDSVSGILVAATDELIERKRQLAEEASLNCVMMDVDGLALLNCLEEYERNKAGQTATAILNVGSTYTNLAIMSDNDLPFTRDIAYAGNEIIKEIATEKDLSTKAVGKILCGGESSKDSESDLSGSLARACEKLIVDVNETLRYYSSREKSTIVDKVFVCGGFALVEGFVELLNNKLSAEVVLWNPFDAIDCDGGQGCREVLEKNGPAMAVAAGLAMRSI